MRLRVYNFAKSIFVRRKIGVSDEFLQGFIIERRQFGLHEGKLCEYFGGQTIKIPTIDQMEETLYAMLLYQYIDIENVKETEALQLININNKDKEKQIKLCYKELKSVLSNYRIQSRDKV